MDFIQAYASLIPKFLPASIASPLLTILTTTLGIFKTLQSHLSPLVTRIITQPDLASVLALAVILFFSLKILGMAYRAVMFWVNLVFQLAMYGIAVGIALWIWNRGMEGFVEDVRELSSFWVGEVARYQGEVKGWKEHQEAQIKFKKWEGDGYPTRGPRFWP